MIATKDEKPKLRVLRGGDQGVEMSEEEKAAESERERDERYGRYYWCVGLVDGTEIHIHADDLRFYDGALILERVKESESSVNMAFASGRWAFVYAASVIDGGAVAVEHWAMPSTAKKKD
jgi:hypothetical protein